MLSLLALLWTAPAAQDTAYFQQEVDYRIEARLDEGSDVLRGRARLRYTNRSPAALDTLWFHQHLNAFRPNSAWARRELELGSRRFQDLGPAEHAYERLTAVEVAGRRVAPVYPLAPDSTVVALPLPAPLPPGATLEARLDWDARLSTLPRRQGRRGRHFDFAHWYPRVAVYDRGGWQVQPLLPQGEFYGEFGSFDVTLDVAADQVIGATGVPVEGDPGWGRHAAAGPALLQRDAYPARPAEPLGLLAGEAAGGRKRVRWRAEQVHHFGWSADPAFIHEGGTVARTGGPGGPVALHVLYLPGDTAWDDGAALRRTADALAWLQRLFGPYPWPQLTNLHRVETGGTEFPMMMMNGSASEGLIVHEGAHQYLHGILANNEWREGHMDEGFTSFVTTWYQEDAGRGAGAWDEALRSVAALERAGQGEPIAQPGADFRDMRAYQAMTYTKASLVFRMLRELVGDETMRRTMRAFYERHRLRHVTEADFQRVAEEVSGRDLGWFFRQWFHSTATLDYGVARAESDRLPGGQWRTRVEVLRVGDAWMPVELRVGDQTRTLDSRETRQVVEIVTRQRPAAVELDPRQILLDADRSNNRREP